MGKFLSEKTANPGLSKLQSLRAGALSVLSRKVPRLLAPADAALRSWCEPLFENRVCSDHRLLERDRNATRDNKIA